MSYFGASGGGAAFLRLSFLSGLDSGGSGKSNPSNKVRSLSGSICGPCCLILPLSRKAKSSPQVCYFTMERDVTQIHCKRSRWLKAMRYQTVKTNIFGELERRVPMLFRALLFWGRKRPRIFNPLSHSRKIPHSDFKKVIHSWKIPVCSEDRSSKSSKGSVNPLLILLSPFLVGK